MARPSKEGLTYFSFDVDTFEDLKLFELNSEFGPLGEAVFLRLLCHVYRQGYYIKTDIDTLALSILKSIGTKWGRSKKVVTQVISRCAEFGLLDKPLLLQGIITSAGIQRRYLKATERRQLHSKEYWLLEQTETAADMSYYAQKTTSNGVNVTETPVNVTETLVKEKYINNKLNMRAREDYSLDDVLAVCREESPVIYQRYMDNPKEQCRIGDVFLDIRRVMTLEEVRALIKAANSGYPGMAGYTRCGLVWVLQRVQEVYRAAADTKKQTTERIGKGGHGCSGNPKVKPFIDRRYTPEELARLFNSLDEEM